MHPDKRLATKITRGPWIRSLVFENRATSWNKDTLLYEVFIGLDRLFNFLGERSVDVKDCIWSDFQNLAALLCKVTKFLVNLISHLVQHHLPQHIPDKRQHLRGKLLNKSLNLFLLLAALVDVPVVIALTRTSSSAVDGVAPADSGQFSLLTLFPLVLQFQELLDFLF